jgi:hypothetical protein
MASRILEAATGGLDHPAFGGVPRTTGREARGHGSAMKLLMFVDGESSLKDLAEVLSLEPGELVRTVVELHEAGIIGFDEGFEKEWLEEPEPAGSAPPPEPPRPEAGPKAERGPDEEGTAARERLELIDEGSDREPPGEPDTEAEGKSEREEFGREGAGEVVEEGRLDDTPCWQVITRLTRSRTTGRLRLSTPEGRRDILLLTGKPVFAISEVPEEDLGALLRARDRIGEEDHERYERARQSTEADPSRILVKLGIVPEYNRLRALRWQVQTIVYNGLAASTGTYLVEELERLPSRLPRFDINFPSVLTRFLDEKLPVEEQIDELEDKMEYYVVAGEQDEPRTFQDKEQRLWEVIRERPRKLKDVMSVSTMFRRETFKFLLLLMVNGLVELVRHVKIEEGPVDPQMLEDLAEDMADQDHFDVLGVHAVSDQKDVEAAYERMREKFDPSSYTRLDDRKRALLARCEERIREAYEVLHDARSRDEYRKQVFSTYKLSQFAQLQYQKGEIFLWWRNEPVLAFPYFRSAFELDPSQPVYWGAYALSALAGGSSDAKVHRQAVELAERIEKLRSVDPVATILAGGALVKAGRTSRGQECFDRAMRVSGGTAAVKKMVKVASSL